MNEERLREMIQKLAPEGASTDFRERAAHAARMATAVRRRRTTFRWSLAATALSGVAVITIGSLAPKASAASVIDRVASQVDAETTMHMVQFDMVRGGKKIAETWYDRGTYRHEDGVETVVRRHGRFFRTAWDQAYVTESDGRERPSLKQLDNFRASGFLRPSEIPGLRFKYAPGRMWQANGRTLSEIVAQQEGDEQRRAVYVIDTARDVFTEIHDQRLVQGRWEDNLVSKFEFGTPVAASTFQPKAFAGKPVFDLAALHATWQKRLQGKVATVRLPDEEVRIHNVWRNTKGWVFVLFTRHGKKAFTDRDQASRVWMEDDRGVAYTRGLFDPSWTWNGEWQPEPLRVAGRKMEGVWMLPTAPTSARSYRLSFDAQRESTRVRLGSVNLTAPAASSALIPPYAPILSLHPFDATMADQMEAYAMQRWWSQRWTDARLRAVPGRDDGEWYGAWGMFPDNPSATPGARLSAQGKEESLEWLYRQLRAETEAERARNERLNNGYLWYRAYELARDLGRGKEAADNLRQAQEKNPEAGYRAQ